MANNNTRRPTRSVNESEAMIKRIGTHIKLTRLKAGYTSIEQFAQQHKFGRTQYARYERGEDMRISSLLKICAAHDMTVLEFFKGLYNK